MRKLLLFFLLAVLMLSNLYSQQNWIDNCDHIPIHSTVWTGWLSANGAAGAIDSMQKAGVEILTPEVINDNFLQQFTQQNRGFIILPGMAIAGSDTLDYINHYTNARYTVWEAEGTPPTVSEAKLEYEDSLMDPINTFIRLKESAATYSDVELIKGPYFQQFVYSPVKMNRWQNNYFELSYYTAEFNLRLISNNNLPDTVNPNTPICIIQVTQSILDTTRSIPGWPFNMGCTLIVKDSIITRSKFNLNQFQNFQLNYTLNNGECSLSPEPNPIYPSLTKRDYVQYKVIWLGQSNYLLDIDQVIVSDQSGRDLKNSFSDAFANIRTQDNIVASSQYLDYVTGWNGADEPHTIDQFEPMRIVDSLLNNETNYKRPTWYPLVGTWDGVWEHHNNPWGTYHLSIWDELKKRVGPINVWQDIYYLDWPCTPEFTDYPCNDCDFRVKNIDIGAMNYEKAYNSFPNFGTSIQCGEQHNIAASQRNVNSNELLYETNLALLYGTKFISLYTYFAQTDIYDPNIISSGTKHAIVDFINSNSPVMSPVNNFTLFYTEKYYTLRDTISPRLKGLMGKTLKRLTPTIQFAGSNGINYFPPTPPESPYSGYSYIDDIYPPTITQNEEYGLDLGFFSDTTDVEKNFFMVLNRHYSQVYEFQVHLKDLNTYVNWKLTNYVDSTCIYLKSVDSKAMFTDTLLNGDANLYSILPVLKYGGKLIYSETVSDGTTLYEDMSIESGATLTVNGTYHAKANITVKTGSKIIAGPNGKIIFDPYKKLIVEGTTEIKGSSPINKLTLEFVYSEKGIDVLPGSSLSLSYCNITGAYYGLVTRTGTPSYLNITYSNFAFGSTGVVLNGNFYGEESSPSPTSTISGCVFTTWGTGISVSNNSSVVISQNNFTSCGISILNVPTAYIQSNSIYSGSNESYSGIFFNNSGGYIRNNFVKNRVNGIHLANSSPDIGGNILEDNYLHGLYIGTGSIPNLVGLVQTNPPTYYALAGYNTIFNNGNNTQANTENDGSEIYFSYSDAYLGTEKFPGCNEISDDRTSTSSMNTVLLLGGYYYNEPHYLDAIYNYWGTTTPYNDRFAIATNYSPYSDKPCSPNGGGEEEMLLAAPSGEVVDTIKSAEGTPLELTALETIYSEADQLFATGNVTQAKPLYEQIVNGSHTAEEKLFAYNKLYAIGNLTGENENYFNNLQSTFEDIANNEIDTLIKKVYSQNAIKCDVSKEEYLTAISKFDNIIQQNPNSEEAVYAEIDIITTALNIDTTNSQLGKMGGGKYLVKGTSDYLSKLNDILQSKFGINSEEKEQIIPKEYSLYQNYPNPFNPLTTIKFDIPNDGLITLEIFDILGRRIATLINEYRTAGSYDQVFNASSLASGVYVYKLQAGDFISSKKMILLK